MAGKNEKTSLKDQKTVEMMKGIYRTTMSYNDDIMLCHFNFDKDASIPLHNHVAAQIGYVIKGKVKFLSKDGGKRHYSRAWGFICL